jgi:hypothetical protein
MPARAATFADNLIKTLWAENAGASISSADRDGVETQADISAYVTVQANLSLGGSVAKAMARRNLLDVCQELAEASTTAGTYLTFEISRQRKHAGAAHLHHAARRRPARVAAASR